MTLKNTNQNKNSSSEAGNKRQKMRMAFKVFWNIIVFIFFLSIIGTFFAFGAGAGYVASLVKDEPIRSYDTMAKEIYNYEETSKLYFAGNEYFGDIRSDIHREKVPLKQIPKLLINAVIATEDEYFKEHNGIVPKAIIRATIQEATHSDVRTGGSTLTQQLIKNQILTNEVSFDRKAKEILLALRLEKFFTKDQIMEAYLNIIPYGREASGRNIAGIKTAAMGIFGITPNELNLPQAAYLAGLPQSPSYYTPYLNGGGLKDAAGLEPGLKRMKLVLNRMYEKEYITKSQKNEALRYDIVADFQQQSQLPITKYPYLAFEIQDRAKAILLEILVKADGYTVDAVKQDPKLLAEYELLADRNLRIGGYQIHSTIDKQIYDKMREVTENYQSYGRDWNGSIKDPQTGEMKPMTQIVQTGSILIENQTGRIISFVGGRKYSEENQLNYATTARRPNGSTMKPLLDYAPAMEKGLIQPGSVVADIPSNFGGWQPKNYGSGYYGLVSARTALAQSYNIPAASIYMKMIQDNPAQDYLGKMGITTLTEGDYSYPSLSLGQPTNGITVEENTNAFATFGNNGQFADAFMIDKIIKESGEVIYQHETVPVNVFSPQTTYLTIDMMRDVLKNGTATYLRSQLNQPGVDWAGKTGTSQNWEDAWFVATNPNVTFGTWLGYNTPKSLNCTNCGLTYSQRNIKLWAQLINGAAEINPELVVPQNKFQQPEGIVSRSYCAISGMLPSDLCSQAGLIQSDLFNAKFVPTQVDDSLTGGSFVMVNGRAVAAGPNTPREFVNGNGLSFNPEFLSRNGYNKLGDISLLYPRTNREVWEKIGFAGAGAGQASGSIANDGKSPSAPTGLNQSGNTLRWTRSGSTDVIGYRIYQGGRLIGHTASTSYTVPNAGASYTVVAVDYFGLQSGVSNATESTKPKVEKNNTPDVPKQEPQEQTEQKPEPEIKPEQKPEPEIKPEQTPNTNVVVPPENTLE